MLAGLANILLCREAVFEYQTLLFRRCSFSAIESTTNVRFEKGFLNLPDFIEMVPVKKDIIVSLKKPRL